MSAGSRESRLRPDRSRHLPAGACGDSRSARSTWETRVMAHYHVELDPQHLQRLGSTTPLTGVTELVWNALDADADRVKVEFGRNALEGVEEIRVVDDGHGMTRNHAVEVFTKLGGSWKREAAGSQGENRALHGRDGRGRFKAAG